MHYRSIAILTVCCFAFGLGGCESFRNTSKPKKEKKSKREYQEVLMPLQTGSVLQRRAYIVRGPDKKKSPTKKQSTPKPSATPEPESSPTPKPEEESSPTPTERFR